MSEVGSSGGVAASAAAASGGSEGDDSGEECAICLCPLADDSSIKSNKMKCVSLSCNHNFHFDCFRQLLDVSGKNLRCPLCRGEPHCIKLPSTRAVTLRDMMEAISRNSSGGGISSSASSTSSSSSSRSSGKRRRLYNCCLCLDACDNVYFSNKISPAPFSIAFDSIGCLGFDPFGCDRTAHLVCAIEKYTYSSKSPPSWHCIPCSAKVEQLE